MTEVHEYAFDVKLFAVVRVVSTSEQTARTAMEQHLDAANISATSTGKDASVFVTEASLYIDDETGPFLFEVDGVETD